MQFYSTNRQSSQASLEEAVMTGLPADGGLYMPERIPLIPRAFFNNIAEMSIRDIAYVVASTMLGDDIDAAELKDIVYNTFTFDIPLRKISSDISVLELFHGPTLAFKDIGARFLARIISHYSRNLDKPVNVLVATSGDSGGAVASGFHRVPGVRVFVLYPERGLSAKQRHQFTSLGDNVIPIEVLGTFDDCQRLVKEAFVDQDLRRKLNITSANSINICRLLPQMFYYFYAYSQLLSGQPDRIDSDGVVFSVPCGNLGNLTAGLLARKMGLPVKRFVVANNSNDSFTRFVRTGHFTPARPHHSIACAMDVGNPSNLSRITDMYNAAPAPISSDMKAYSYSDDEIADSIADLYRSHRYIADPHAATAYRALAEDLKDGENGIFLATAHPAKFADIVGRITGTEIKNPQQDSTGCISVRHDVPKITPALQALKKILITST
ncbi:threonine synthase [Duncaniella muris]|uniref:threonine synthase n=1 Tax=Duncaniella muris TaxID=2094150 RepID=UPI0025AA2CA1|nr:threonine synthase [Duncaniella muris]